MRRLVLVLAAVAVAATSCGGSSTPASDTPAARTAPDLAGFLRLPVATPSACPSNVNGTTVGRSSPWVGHVDVSVFLNPTVTTHQILKLGNDLRADPLVSHAYFESASQAYDEFKRLYTCWAAVPESQTPASYRLVLAHTATLGERDVLVARLSTRPDVDSVSCDPSVPCVDVVQSGQPKS